MPQTENLYGHFKPPTGLSFDYTPNIEGQRLGGLATLTIRHHQPEPNIVVGEELNEWAAAWLPQVFEHTWDAWKFGSDHQVKLAFEVMCHRLRTEWHGP